MSTHDNRLVYPSVNGVGKTRLQSGRITRRTVRPAKNSLRTLFRIAVITAAALFASFSPVASRIEHLIAPAAFAETVETVTVFDDDCSTPKIYFAPGETVCAKVQGSTAPYEGFRQRRFQWGTPGLLEARQRDVFAEEQIDMFVIPTSGEFARLGRWSVRTIDTDAGARAGAIFYVRDRRVLHADLSILKDSLREYLPGDIAEFTVTVANNGPDVARDVIFADEVPSNMTFRTLRQTSGPDFTCDGPGSGSTGTTKCSIEGLRHGEEAVFTFYYVVDSDVREGTVSTSVVKVSSGSEELHTPDNNAETEGIVVGQYSGEDPPPVEEP